ncbi:LarC family nickel insertion protein [Sodalis sp. RH21]|uniref:LarC family nickel insertion protein n=1 Tax=unclassified Sodalis (in: enterobacteria) TaxID=2636512 RepID=UPI0039B3A112
MQIQIDALGGVAGDMFCAGMLDAFPHLQPGLLDFLQDILCINDISVDIETSRGLFSLGKRFIVKKRKVKIDDKHHFYYKKIDDSIDNSTLIHHADHKHQHRHYSWQKIKKDLKKYCSRQDIHECAEGIFSILVNAESIIHGVPMEDVHLHEVGADDAMIDIMSAAYLIMESGADSWSISSLPLGGGAIKCEHGTIPVPAPATLLILRGFLWHDDGIPGERVTPTGAAILAWLVQHMPNMVISGRLIHYGYGIGERRFGDILNALRITVYDHGQEVNDPLSADSIYIVQCDIDDMTPELLALAINNLRGTEGIIDISSQMIMGKKNRWATRLELLIRLDVLDNIARKILTETSTLGVRYWQADRKVLQRNSSVFTFDNNDWQVKTTKRPDGNISCKIESDNLIQVDYGYESRMRLKYEIEKAAAKSVRLKDKE